MNISSDPSQFEARTKVLKFPGSPLSVRKSGSSVTKYWLIGALMAVVIVAGGAMAWLTLVGPVPFNM